MKRIISIVGHILFFLTAGVFLTYLVLPNRDFPSPLPGAVQSEEFADMETPLRRAYFTNFNREEVIDYYKNQFEKPLILKIYIPALRLNYPPEDAQTLIRDQARSTFLEELAYPFRESLYINGFKPKVAKDDIWYKGVHYEEKITVRFVPNGIIRRLLVGMVTVAAAYILAKEWRRA